MTLTRRRTLQGLASLAAPALLGRALPAQAQSAFAGEGLVVGDSDNDVLAAAAAGIPSCAVSYGMGDPACLRASRPGLIIDRFEERGNRTEPKPKRGPTSHPLTDRFGESVVRSPILNKHSWCILQL